MNRIYMNNCVTTRIDDEVLDHMIPYMKDRFYFPANFIKTGEETNDMITAAKQAIAETINADTNEVHFTKGGTSANNLAIKGFLTANASKGTHIICSVVDYPDILTNASFFESSGFDVSYISCDDKGFINLDELKAAIREDTVLFMTTLANHTSGTIQPIAKIREILDTANHRIYFHVDACQAYGKIDINVNNPQIDLMSLSAHKIHGPQGIGALYQRKGVVLGQIHHGISRIDNLENGGISIAGIAGFHKAVEVLFRDIKGYRSHLKEMSDYLFSRVKNDIPYILINGPEGDERILHNVNISFDFIEGEAIMMMMDIQDIIVATGSACASQGLKPNYILMAMGRSHEQSHGSIKFTLSKYTTKEEIDRTVSSLAEIVEKLRLRSPLYNQ